LSPYVGGPSPIAGLYQGLTEGTQLSLQKKEQRRRQQLADAEIQDAERRWNAQVSQMEFQRTLAHAQEGRAEQDQQMQRGQFEDNQLTGQLQRKALGQQIDTRGQQQAQAEDEDTAQARASIDNLMSLAQRHPELRDEAMNTAGVMAQIKTPQGRTAYAAGRFPVLAQRAKELEDQKANKDLLEGFMTGKLSDGNPENDKQLGTLVQAMMKDTSLTPYQKIQFIHGRMKEIATRKADEAERTEGTQGMLNTYMTRLDQIKQDMEGLGGAFPRGLRREVRNRIAMFAQGIGTVEDAEDEVKGMIAQAFKPDTGQVSPKDMLGLTMQRARMGQQVEDPIMKGKFTQQPIGMDAAEADVKKRLGGGAQPGKMTPQERSAKAQEIANKVRQSGGTKEDLIRELQNAGLQ
jgi:hypothetical protein